jgi:hypothetical protein
MYNDRLLAIYHACSLHHFEVKGLEAGLQAITRLASKYAMAAADMFRNRT